jgi:hypothetical protein
LKQPLAATASAALAAADGMVFVPAGEFTMGSDDGPHDDRPAHQVTLVTFHIDRYPEAELDGLPPYPFDPAVAGKSRRQAPLERGRLSAC